MNNRIFILTTSILFLGGCQSLSTKDAVEQQKILIEQQLKSIIAYRKACDEDILSGKYSLHCDYYIQYTDNPPFVNEPVIAKTREHYKNIQKEYRAKQLKEEYQPDTLAKLDDKSLCLKFNQGVYEGKIHSKSQPLKNITAELKKRKFKEKHITNAMNNKATIGMPICMLYAAWGRPDKENRTVHKNLTSIQHIYGENFNKRTYFYSDNGTITSFQD